MSAMTDAIAAHRAAWQAFQDSPDTGFTDAMWKILDAECEAYHTVLSTIPETSADLAELKAYLDWWVVEEAQRRDREPEFFALHAALNLSHGNPPAWSRNGTDRPEGALAFERPNGVSKDIWEQLRTWDDDIPWGDEMLVSPIVIARAIQMERDRCVALALKEMDRRDVSGALPCLQISVAIIEGKRAS